MVAFFKESLPVEKSYKPWDTNILVRNMVKTPVIMTWRCLLRMAKAGLRVLKENHTAFPLATECKAIIWKDD